MSSVKSIETADKGSSVLETRQSNLKAPVGRRSKKLLGKRKSKPQIQDAFNVMRPCDWERLGSLPAESEQEEAFIKQVILNGPSRSLHSGRENVLNEIASLFHSFPNFSDVTTHIMGRYKISLLGGTPLSLPVINLQGPPGIGKTTYIRAVAAALGQPFHDLKISQMMEKFELVGMSKGWRGARPGKIAKILLEEEANEGQPVLFFDELCMAKDTDDHSVIHPLYTLFDRDSAGYFRDLFLDMPMDTSHALIFCATNNFEVLRPALKSRLLNFEIEAPSSSQMRQMAQTLYAECLEQLNVAENFPSLLGNDILRRLTQGSIRDMKLNIERAIIRAVGEAIHQDIFRLLPEYIPAADDERSGIGFI
ncbi:ATPase family associated with various cellular activities (AAA) [Marinobacter sp. es.048]|uniref:ATP-binding protein n=1 Tax=Marinobacter sp. es.048 TaxID=1761795 RepID=UPI000B5889DF|nr:AAA family ATPase [Marinobacter sp. es.048]SNC59397.1 ATPase family associated with various cellular activities (AAA) [Marinobacter sp. es.048]